jgi:acyl dehydratase
MGMNNIKFIKPVFPGDRLQTIVEVIDKKPVKEKMGMITILLSAFNDKKEKVLAGELSVLIRC